MAFGLGAGVALGFLLQKGRVTRHEVVVGQFLLRDFTLAKILLTAVAVGAVGVWGLASVGLTTIAPEPAQLVGVLVGAALFGVGVVVLGYCPAGAIAAAGEGKHDARVGVAGMIFGAFAFVVTYDVVVPALRALSDLGAITWPALTRSSPWPWVGGVVGLALTVYAITRARLHRAAHHRP
jgi:uncharacterized membrane protein YedE/YeeE